MCSNLFPENQTTIFSTNEHDETRRVITAYDDNCDLIIAERTDGETTFSAFGTYTHICMLTIKKQNISSFLVAIGCKDVVVDQALSSFFANDRVLLSDLQDVLDAAGVAYACTVWNGSEAAFRAAQAQEAVSAIQS